MPRELFELRIQTSEHFEVALSIDNAALADVYCLRFPVDLILMDVVTRNGESGLDAAERIKRAFPQIKIIIVTSMPECSYLSRAREIGVESFWYKEEQRESLLDVMTRTMAGESVYPDATPELQLGLASSYQFTSRELEVLREARRDVSDTPQTMVTYYVSRCISNAFRRVVYSYEKPRDVIYRYSDDLDLEFDRKKEVMQEVGE